MRFSSRDIIEIYSYTEDEQETFNYLRRYMKLISPKLAEIEKDREKLKRFALIGLFLAYRSCNHMGDTLTTEKDYGEKYKEDFYVKRLAAIKEYFGLKILNTDE